MFSRATLLGCLALMASFSIPAVSAESKAPSPWATVQQSLGISPEMARVTDAFMPVGRPFSVQPDFILIQDVHRNPDVQTSIASLIMQGYQRWGVTKVFMEGAFAPLDLSLFHRIPKSVLPGLVKRLINEGDLSGPELAAVRIMEVEWSNPPTSPFQLYGLEDPALYRQNVMAYQAVLARRDKALYDVASIRKKYLVPMNRDAVTGDQALELLEKLLRLKLTPKEHEVFLMYRDAVPVTPDLTPAVQAATEYYRLARLRSGTFLKQAVQKAPASAAPRILVVGGFHTDDMAQQLRREGRSFVVLSPVVASSKGGSIYEQRLQETVLTYVDTLAPKKRHDPR